MRYSQSYRDKNTNLEYNNEEKEEVGIATKLVKQEKRQEGEYIIFCCTDFVGAEFLPVLHRVVDMDGPVWHHPLSISFSARLPVHDDFLQSLPPSQHPSPWATSWTTCAVAFVSDPVPQWPLCRCTHDRPLASLTTIG